MRIPHEWAGAVLGSCVAILCATALAQERPSLAEATTVTVSGHKGKAKEASPPPSLRMDVNRVFIPVTVTDQDDKRIEGLKSEDFRIFEDGAPQAISEFFMDEAPASMGVLLDSSSSMKDKFDLSKKAIASFLRLCPPLDEYLLVTVQDRPQLVHAFTDHVEDIQGVMDAVTPNGWTALYDGIYLAVNHLKRGLWSQRALLVLSDGGDNNSRYSESEIRETIRESGVRVFSVSVLGRSGSMEKFSEESGGRAFQAHRLEELPDLAWKISELVHGEYVIGFAPANHPRDGKYHTIRVQLAPSPENKGLRVTWRHGYYAPVQ